MTEFANFDVVVVLVGANDMGKLKVEDTITELRELMCLLQDANPKGAVYACEVMVILYLHKTKTTL